MTSGGANIPTGGPESPPQRPDDLEAKIKKAVEAGTHEMHEKITKLTGELEAIKTKINEHAGQQPTSSEKQSSGGKGHENVRHLGSGEKHTASNPLIFDRLNKKPLLTGALAAGLTAGAVAAAPMIGNIHLTNIVGGLQSLLMSMGLGTGPAATSLFMASLPGWLAPAIAAGIAVPTGIFALRQGERLIRWMGRKTGSLANTVIGKPTKYVWDHTKTPRNAIGKALKPTGLGAAATVGGGMLASFMGAPVVIPTMAAGYVAGNFLSNKAKASAGKSSSATASAHH